MLDTEAAYIAGLLDGEGCLRIRRQVVKRKTMVSIYHMATIEIVMVSKPSLDWVCEKSGLGRVTFMRRRAVICGSVWRWGISGRKAACLLRRLLPFLINKKAEAELLIALVDTMDSTRSPVPESLIEWRDQCRLACSAAKRKPDLG